MLLASSHAPAPPDLQLLLERRVEVLVQVHHETRSRLARARIACLRRRRGCGRRDRRDTALHEELGLHRAERAHDAPPQHALVVASSRSTLLSCCFFLRPLCSFLILLILLILHVFFIFIVLGFVFFH